ncbi:uncharacterized protein METZ01_LOCUS323592, partial [marine metagenome]
VNRIGIKLKICLVTFILFFILVITAEAVKGDKRESKTFSLKNG